MAIVLREVGAGATVYSPFTAAASGTDYVSNYDPNDDYISLTGDSAPLTGKIGDSFSRPILYSYLQIYSSAGGSGTVDLQIAEDIDGAGGSGNYSVPISTASNDWNIADASGGLAYPAFARVPYLDGFRTVRHYYGFQKNDSNTFTFRRAATTNSSYNPNGIYQNGTSVTTGSPAWSSTAINARIRFYTVPTAPTSVSSTSKTSSSITLSWSAPTDPGAMDSLVGGGTIYAHHDVYGYRILTSTDNTNWYVYGTGTTGSPSGTHDIAFGTGSPTPPTTVTVTSHNGSPLQPGTDYYFKIAALNVTTDSHAGATVTPFASRTFGDYKTTGTKTGINAHTGTNADIGPIKTLATPKVYNGSSIVYSTPKVWNGSAWISDSEATPVRVKVWKEDSWVPLK
jgi:hypothetical protein